MNTPTGYTALDLIGFSDKGEYSSSATYVKNDLVHYGASVWKCKLDDTTAQTPAEGTYWTLFVAGPDTSIFKTLAGDTEITTAVNLDTMKSTGNFYKADNTLTVSGVPTDVDPTTDLFRLTVEKTLGASDTKVKQTLEVSGGSAYARVFDGTDWGNWGAAGGGGGAAGALMADGSVPADNLTIGTRAEGSTVGTNSFAQGVNVIAPSTAAHAEGTGTTASGNYSHAEGSNTTASGDSSHAEGKSATQGSYDSTTETRAGILASNNGAHAEGYTFSSENFIHATGQGAHAEGYAVGTTGTLASGSGSHAEGKNTTAIGHDSHAEGDTTTATSNSSHAEGYNTTVGGTIAQGAHVEGYSKVKGSDTVGIYASANGAHAEGIVNNNTCFIRATGIGAHAEGYAGTMNERGTLASGNGSHAECCETTASGNYSHAEGCLTIASGRISHAEGTSTTAMGQVSHAEGAYTTAGDYNHAQGHNNKEMAAGTSATTVGDAMVIGNGSFGSLSNCFRVTYSGAVYGLSAFNSSGADYAEFFEWKDGNESSEDRVGLFVTLDGNKIIPANAGDYILGVVSGQPSVIGNGDEDWLGRWQRDDFGRFIWGDVETKNPETGEVEKGRTILPNPDYDNTQKYIERKDRKEWDCVGMLGTLAVRDNGECEVNGFCDCGANGIAVPAETGYRVITRVSENVVKIIVK